MCRWFISLSQTVVCCSKMYVSLKLMSAFMELVVHSDHIKLYSESYLPLFKDSSKYVVPFFITQKPKSFDIDSANKR